MASSTISFHFHLFPASSPHIYFPQSNKKSLFSPKGKNRAWKLLQKKEKKLREACKVIRAAGFSAGIISVEEKKKMDGREGFAFNSTLIEYTAEALYYFRVRSFWWRLNVQVVFEKAIMNCRFFTLIGVFGSLVGSVLCFFEGCFLILKSYFEYFFTISKSLDKGDVLQLILEALDTFLVGAAMLMFGMGLYSMFIGNRETPRKIKGFLTNGSNLFGLFRLQILPAWIKMTSVAEEKSRIGHAVVMLLQVGMLDKLKSVSVATGIDLACFAASIFTASAAVFLLARIHSNRTKLKD